MSIGKTQTSDILKFRQATRDPPPAPPSWQDLIMGHVAGTKPQLIDTHTLKCSSDIFSISQYQYEIAKLLCGRRPQEWSPILILRGMLVFFYGHGKRNGSRARAPYVRPSHFMTFLHEAIFAQLLANGVQGIA